MRITIHEEAFYQVIYRDYQGQLPPALELQYLYHSWVDTAKIMEAEHTKHRFGLLENSGNAKYHHSKLLDQLEVLRKIGVKVEVVGKT